MPVPRCTSGDCSCSRYDQGILQCTFKPTKHRLLERLTSRARAHSMLLSVERALIPKEPLPVTFSIASRRRSRW